jgi:filamentous hemagglutinin family protein
MFIDRIANAYLMLSINVFGIFVLENKSVFCQIIPDQTLGAESSVVNNNIIVNGSAGDLISGGAIRGPNLFHSFQEFNINTGSQAYFINPNGIRFIIARITGGTPSFILGNLGVLGNSDLFFINPNGIIFGKNSSLNLNGSFFVLIFLIYLSTVL